MAFENQMTPEQLKKNQQPSSAQTPQPKPSLQRPKKDKAQTLQTQQPVPVVQPIPKRTDKPPMGLQTQPSAALPKIQIRGRGQSRVAAPPKRIETRQQTKKRLKAEKAAMIAERDRARKKRQMEKALKKQASKLLPAASQSAQITASNSLTQKAMPRSPLPSVSSGKNTNNPPQQNSSSKSAPNPAAKKRKKLKLQLPGQDPYNPLG